MKISYNWLKNYLDIDMDAEAVGEILTDLGLEVEGIEKIQSVKGGLKGVIAGKVLTCVKHPNADKLSLTTVDLGDGKPVPIVCGAPNVAEGQIVPVATIGTILYDDKGKEFKIKKGKIRGEESHGMICAEDELGLGDSHDGIMVLEEDVKPGTPLAEVFEVEEDEVFEIGLTPNRTDAMSHFGVARDLWAGLKQRGLNPSLIEPPVLHFNVDNHLYNISVEVEDRKLAPRYTGVSITNLKVKESPLWLQNRLRSIGLKPINNVVDITNFVMHELGQPLHAFDANAIKGQKIVVKTLPAGTAFVTLDGVKRELHEEDIMICDAEDNPLCIAGVYGGLDSGVTEKTTDMFLESAYFDPIAIRKTSKRHGLHTDASFRFERGVDVNTVDMALKRAASLIVELAGGKISSNIQEFYPVKLENHQVLLHYKNVNKLIGEIIPKDVIKSILTSLDIKIISETPHSLGLKIPTYRTDVYREADVVEELLRIYGYNNIEFPGQIRFSIVSEDDYKEKFKRKISSFLTSRGFYEIMTNSLTKEEYISEEEMPSTVKLLNPLSTDLSVLRKTMVNSVLESVAFNINRKNNDLMFFEWGKTYSKKGDEYKEKEHLIVLTTGHFYKESWLEGKKKADFYYLKGVLQDMLQASNVDSTGHKSFSNDFIQGGLEIPDMGYYGKVDPEVCARFGIKQEVYYACLDMQAWMKMSKKKTVKFNELPKYPEVRRDLALLVDKGITYDELYQKAFETEKKLLKKISLFDVYEGKKIPKAKKSYALSFILQDKNKTLNDKQIDKVMKRIFEAYAKSFGAELRQ